MHTIALSPIQRHTFSLTTDMYVASRFRESSSVTSDFELELQQLEIIYDLRDRGRVHTFLRYHRDLVPLLREAPRYILFHFSRYTALVLEVVEDAEVENWQQLFLNIVTTIEPQQAADNLHRLDQEWLRTHKANGLLVFDVELL